jgi:hypothetical protein
VYIQYEQQYDGRDANLFFFRENPQDSDSEVELLR